MNKNNYLGLINLSGIHEFISESRKLVELNYSSKMVCKIMYNLVMALKDGSDAVDETMHGPARRIQERIDVTDFIIPPDVDDVDEDSKGHGYPNQLLFAFTGNPDGIETKLNEIVQTYFKRKGEESLKWAQQFTPHADVWKTQWADALPLFFEYGALDENDFPSCHRKLQKRLIARKFNREFRQWPAGKPIQKCIQCGRRENAGPTEDDGANRAFWKEQVEDYVKKGWLKANERLCPVCLGKRILALKDDDKQPIPTTTFIAAYPFLEGLPGWIQGKRSTLWQGFLSEVKSINECLEPNFPDKFKELPNESLSCLVQPKYKNNAQWFYEDFYSSRNFEEAARCTPEDLSNRLESGKKALHEFLALKQSSAAGLPTEPISPSKYLALIEYDGDQMGQKRASLFLDRLKSVSNCISALSKADIPCIVARHNGFLIYSGGEDVLAFAPMSKALAAVTEVNNTFASRLNTTGQISFTGSGSITFFPYDFPLQLALQISGQNLARAKEEFNRKSLVMGAVLPDSSQIVFNGKWYNKENQPSHELFDLLEDSIRWFTRPGKDFAGVSVRISRACLYDILSTLPVFYDSKTGALMFKTRKGLEDEIVRLLLRHVIDCPEDRKARVRDACWSYVKNLMNVLLSPYKFDQGAFGLSYVQSFFKLIDFYANRVEAI